MNIILKRQYQEENPMAQVIADKILCFASYMLPRWEGGTELGSYLQLYILLNVIYYRHILHL